MLAGLEIPELLELQAGRSLIRVPAEQNVPLTDRVRSLIDTVEFQRLNQISQLGLVAKVYPGARHTRFEHALGVYHNALRYLQQLSQDDRFAELVSLHDAEVLIVASLLHDLGHWPFCHPIEDLGLQQLPPHELHAERFLGTGTELAAVLKEQWQIEPVEVLEVLVPRRTQRSTDAARSTTLKLLRSILSGPIDVDKMDYLDRDSLHCGVPYGRNFDRQRLIQSLMLNERGDGLAITAKGKTAAELMVFARYVMFSEVYWHHAVRSATCMFARAFYELYGELDLHALLGSTDAEMIAALQAGAAGKPAASLLEGIFGSRRALYKRAAEYSHDQAPEIYERIAGRPYVEVVRMAALLTDQVQARSGHQLSAVDLLIDAPPPHREVELAVDVYFPKQQAYRAFRQVSPVVDALATRQFDDWVKRVRIFVTPTVQSELKEFDWDAAVLDALQHAAD